MGLIDTLQGSKVCIDTAPFIYFIEKQEKYREILLYSEGLTTFEVLNNISEKAAELRAKYSIKTPDAIQIATAIIHGANNFLTNDPVLQKIDSIQVLVLDEVIP